MRRTCRSFAVRSATKKSMNAQRKSFLCRDVCDVRPLRKYRFGNGVAERSVHV